MLALACSSSLQVRVRSYACVCVCVCACVCVCVFLSVCLCASAHAIGLRDFCEMLSFSDTERGHFLTHLCESFSFRMMLKLKLSVCTLDNYTSNNYFYHFCQR